MMAIAINIDQYWSMFIDVGGIGRGRWWNCDESVMKVRCKLHYYFACHLRKMCKALQ